MAYSTRRPSTFLSTAADGPGREDSSLLYRDIDLFLLRDPDCDDEKPRTILGMRVTLRLLKGKQNVGVPSTLFFHERDDNLAFCPVLHLLALAFHDQAFLSEHIKKPSDLSQFTPSRDSLPLEWHDDWLDRPILRSSEKTAFGRSTSLGAGANSRDMSRWFKRVGTEAGFFPPPKLYSIRRGAGAAVDKHATDAVRNRIMGHENSEIYAKYYTPQLVQLDTQSAFLQTPLKSSLVQFACQMSFTRDPGALTEVNRTLKAKIATAIEQHEMLQELRLQLRDLAVLKERHVERHATVEEAQAAEPGLFSTYNSLKLTEGYRVKKITRDVTSRAWQRHFREIGAREIERQMRRAQTGEKYAQKVEVIPDFRFEERRVLARLMCRNVDCEQESREEIAKARAEALEALISLCRRTEPPSRKRSRTPDDIAHLDIPCFTEEWRLEYCPWCFYYDRVPYETRTRTFGTDST